MIKIIPKSQKKKISLAVKIELITWGELKRKTEKHFLKPAGKAFNRIRLYSKRINRGVRVDSVSLLKAARNKTLGFYLRAKAIAIVFAKQTKISFKKKGNKRLLLLCWTVKSKKPVFVLEDVLATAFKGLFCNLGLAMKGTGTKLIHFGKKNATKAGKAGFGIFLLALIVSAVMFVSNDLKAEEQEEEFCPVDVNVVMVMDVSGSMEEGAAESQCEWWEMEFIPKEQVYKWVLHTDYDVTEEWCLAKDKPSPRNSVFYPATSSKLDSAKTAANSFLNNLKQNDLSAVVSFSDQASLEKELSDDHQASQDIIQGLLAGGATNIGDAIALAVQELGSEKADSQANKVIILLTDGKANDPETVMQKAQEAADLNYKIFTIGLGSDEEINEEMLENIAELTNAQYYQADNGNDLTEIYEQIAFEVCQYGSIAGCKYADINNDNDITGEETLAGWEIVLTGDAQASQITDENGCYVFAGLLQGNYVISEGENADKLPFTQTYPEDLVWEIELNEGENLTEIDFGNYVPGPEPKTFSIFGLKFSDENNNSQKDETETGLADWTIILTDTNSLNSTTITDTEGNYSFLNLEPGFYNVCEQEQENWVQTYPQDNQGCHILQIIDQDLLNIDFGNYYLDPAEQVPGCTDPEALNYNPEANIDDESCEYDIFGCTDPDALNYNPDATSDNGSCEYEQPSNPGGGGSSGGIGAGYVRLEITDQEITVQEDGIVITWKTTRPATSRVVYDIVAHSELGSPPNYGYAFSTPQDPEKVTDHSVTITDLIPGTAYYFRIISAASPEIISDELSFTIVEKAPEPECGNSILEEGEECDDGNLENNDGCSSVCEIEALGEQEEEEEEEEEETPIPQLEEIRSDNENRPGPEIEKNIPEDAEPTSATIEQNLIEGFEEIKEETGEIQETKTAELGFSAAVGDFIREKNLCWLLILVVASLIVLFFYLIKKGKIEEKKLCWIPLLVIIVLLVVDYLYCPYFWVVLIGALVFSAIVYIAMMLKA